MPPIGFSPFSTPLSLRFIFRIISLNSWLCRVKIFERVTWLWQSRYWIKSSLMLTGINWMETSWKLFLRRHGTPGRFSRFQQTAFFFVKIETRTTVFWDRLLQHWLVSFVKKCVWICWLLLLLPQNSFPLLINPMKAFQNVNLCGVG